MMLDGLLAGGVRSWTSPDGRVVATIQVESDGLVIYEWSSHDSGKGNSTRALQALRAQHPRRRVRAVGIGSSPSDESWRFWVRMRARGLVDALEDDEGKSV